MGEENKATEMVAYIDGQPVGAIQGIPEMSTLEEPESQAGNLETLKAVAAAKFEGAISAEQLEEAVETIRAAFTALAATFERVDEVMRAAVSAIAWGYELQRAIQWAEIYNPRGTFDMDAVGMVGEVGIFQLNPGPDGRYHAAIEEATGLDPKTPMGNIAGGCYLLGKYIDDYDGDLTKVAMAYNMGPSGAAKAWAAGITSTEYSREVLDAMEKWAALVNAWRGI